MSEKPNETHPMLDFDGWRVNPDTPTVVLTPHGRIGVNWTSNNPSDGTAERAESAALLIASAPKLAEAWAEYLFAFDDGIADLGGPPHSGLTSSEREAMRNRAMAKARAALSACHQRPIMFPARRNPGEADSP